MRTNLLTCLVSLLLLLNACHRSEHSFSSQVICYTSYENIELTLTNEETGATRLLEIEEDGRVVFNELPGVEHTLHTKVMEEGIPYPTFEAKHLFIPGDQGGELLSISGSVDVFDVAFERSNEEFSVSGRFEQGPCLAADSVYVYGSVDWPFPFDRAHRFFAHGNGFQSTFDVPIKDTTYHVVYEFISNYRGRRTVVRSEPIGSNLDGLNYKIVTFGKQYSFAMETGETMSFDAFLEEGHLYLIEFWDQHNSSDYTGEEMVVELKGLLSDVRTKLPAGAAVPLYGWRDAPVLINCYVSAYTTPGSYGLRVTELTDLPSEELTDTIAFTENTEVRLFRVPLSSGDRKFHYRRINDGSDGRVKFSLFKGTDFKNITLNDGPSYPADSAIDRWFSLPVPQSLDLIMTSTYEGAPGKVRAWFE
ncbi:MAG: hypothetical protein HQ500_12480 [Flavobacteriales bacterium]|nr:hypothetical protein [Flavobacteriales bacterium]